MVATELILGMEELVNHIRELEVKNKKLEEENKKLKEKEEEYQPKGSQVDPEGLHDYMKEEIDKLKKENYEKQGTIESLEDDLEECNEYRNMYGEFYEPDEFEALDKENKKLKEEVRQYEYESNESGVKEKKLYEQLFSFQAEIEKLKQKNDDWTKKCVVFAVKQKEIECKELKCMRDVICQELYMCERDKRNKVCWQDLVDWTDYKEHKARIEKTFDEEDRIKKD